MNNEKGHFVKNFLVFMLFVSVCLFGYVYLVHEIKSMNREIANRQNELKAKQDKIERKIVEIQKLSSEERIVQIASNELGLVRSAEYFEVLHIDKFKLERLNNIINGKYD